MPAWASLSTWMQAQKGNARAEQLPINIALTGDRSIFEYLSQPENALRLSYAAALMGHWKQGTSDWLSVYPIEIQAKDLDPERALFVDVGGGLGHQCQLLSQKHPDLKGRVILQDRPEVLDSAPLIDGLEFVAQDFFEEQVIRGTYPTCFSSNPITRSLFPLVPLPTPANRLTGWRYPLGARIYYLRWILHDWPDQSCISILRSIRSVMATDSCIIVDDLVCARNPHLPKHRIRSVRSVLSNFPNQMS